MAEQGPMTRMLNAEARVTELEAELKRVALMKRIEAREHVANELSRIVREIGSAENVLILTDYEVANLRELFHAIGIGAVVARNPLQVVHNGDWTAQVASKLPYVKHPPNESWETLAKRALEWK